MLEIAAKMRGETVDELPEELIDRLEDVDHLCSQAGTQLVSRQLIAFICFQYQREREAI